ncbi:DUF3551 domain-containing protein [Bradyrhizobium sp. CB82]|uniref:DUF3551 domain-containing protein n=1 Tax=Bradyrhizobium sp. CB82 TaxID=3039159 RepID=UPI0024B1D2E0|nr:DUF3551 domain-containing protein [Bradyrhizobium sp. CB82]WFU37937.1 DUF3551 domain-containing protein [Bradyrhizobium sp. CB82]
MRTKVMMGALAAGIIAGAAIMTAAPATAQRYDARYPVCLQKWEWGGSSTIYCNYPSWEACKASAAGLSAMCIANPYWAESTTTGFARPPAPAGRPLPAR